MNRDSAMNCEDVEAVLDAYADGELSARDRTAVERHVGGCENCARNLARITALGRRVRDLGRYPLPDAVSENIAAIVSRGPARQGSSGWRHGFMHALTPALVASHVVAALVGAIVVVAWLHAETRDPGDSTRRGIVAAHVHGLAQEQFRPVESGDPHVVRPWFAGKLAFAPRVVDLAESGFPLQGGRVDRVLDQPAAALIYLRRNHRVTLFIVPTDSRESRDDAGGQQAGERGYHLTSWRDSEFTYWAVSDLNRAELSTFAERLRAEIARAAARPSQ